MSNTDGSERAPFAGLPPLPAPTEREDGAVHYAGVTYAIPPGYRPLQLDLWVPVAAAPPRVAVWVHGGSWMSGDRRLLPARFQPGQIFDALMDAGLSVATIDYRLAREAPFPAQLHDVKAAIRYLRAHADQLGLDTSRIGIWGESAGGHLAALAGLTAHRPDLEGDVGVCGPSSAVDMVVDWYGPSDLELLAVTPWPPQLDAGQPPELPDDPLDSLLAGVDAATRADASPVSHVSSGAPPFLLVHGTEDALVPHAQSEVLAAELRKAEVPVELLSVAGAAHVFDGYEDLSALVRYSADHLASALLEGRSRVWEAPRSAERPWRPRA